MKLAARTGLLAGALGVGLLGAAPAQAAVPVDLRIEGPTKTIFEGRVKVPVRTFSFTGERARHPCDATAAIGGASARPRPTRGAALAEASERFGFAIDGTWNTSFGATFTTVGGQDVAYDAATSRYLAEYENGAFAQLGACADPVRAGDAVLFAYGDGSAPLLALRAPATVRPGRAIPVRVTNAATRAAVTGATVRGATTGADGAAAVAALPRGYHALKAFQPGAIRSNVVRVCVSTGTDGACPPLARITDIRPGQRFRPASAPRRLRGVVEAAPFGLRSVALRLTKRVGDRSYAYSDARGRFARTRGGRAGLFAIARARDWSYALPRRLARGRYVLDAVATDRRGVAPAPRGGTTRVPFSVR
jgi:hypothetical protein